MFLEVLVISVLLSGHQVTPNDRVNVTVTKVEVNQAISISSDPPMLVNKNPEAVGEAAAAAVPFQETPKEVNLSDATTAAASGKVPDPNTGSYPVVTKEEAPAEKMQMEEAPAETIYPRYPWEQKYGGKGGDISGLPVYHPLLGFKTSTNSKSSRLELEEKDPYTGEVINPSKKSHSKGWFHQAQPTNQLGNEYPYRRRSSEEESK